MTGLLEPRSTGVGFSADALLVAATRAKADNWIVTNLILKMKVFIGLVRTFGRPGSSFYDARN